MNWKTIWIRQKWGNEWMNEWMRMEVKGLEVRDSKSEYKTMRMSMNDLHRV